jgi:hypothetical protein
MRNNAGSFCPDCESQRKLRVTESQKKRIRDLDNCCLWCGDKVEDYKIGSDDHICEGCKRMRDRLLKCIRNSGRVARYVSIREEAEALNRKARIAAKNEAKKEVTTESMPTETEARLLRMERMLNQITSALR